MMDDSYIIGVIAAVAAGIIYNLGMLIQKLAVMKVKNDGPLMRTLIRSPLWLAGLGLQFFIGIPLHIFAQVAIGPAIIPGLMSAGLVVMAIGAAKIAHESFIPSEVLGIFLMILSTILISMSGFSIRMDTIDFFSQSFLIRLIVFSFILGLLSLGCHLFQSRIVRLQGVLRMIDSGLFFAQSNLWAGILVTFFPKLGSGSLSGGDILAMGVVLIMTGACSLLGVTETQRAFQVGEASKLIPVQYVPVQILPIISYFAVFQLTPPSLAAVLLVSAAVILVLAGSALLARRQVMMNDK